MEYKYHVSLLPLPNTGASKGKDGRKRGMSVILTDTIDKTTQKQCVPSFLLVASHNLIMSKIF